MDDIYELLRSNEKIVGILKKAIQVQTKDMRDRGITKIEDYLGFEWYQVEASPQTLNRLVTAGILEVSYKSNRSTCYRVKDPERLLAIINEVESGNIEPKPVLEIPNDLFEIVVGHDDVKEILWRSIRSQQPVHILLHGTPASAKSLILEELARLPNSRLVLGSSLSKAGLIEVLFENRPRYLIIDEVDKIDTEDNLSCLLSLMERGTVTETKYKRHRTIRLTTTVFAACNKVEVLPPELLSRFLRLRFRDYTPEEFMEVSMYVLTSREGIPPQLAYYIASSVMTELASRDVRDCIKVARLLTEKTQEDASRIIKIIKSRR